MDLSLLTPQNLLIWIGAWTIIGLALMGEDKNLAENQRQSEHPDRIGERTLHEVAFIGGFLGIIIGAKIFHHTAAKSSFWGPVAIAVFLWIVLFASISRNQPPGFS